MTARRARNFIACRLFANHSVGFLMFLLRFHFSPFLALGTEISEFFTTSIGLSGLA
jgi:hypothetical protein